MVEDSIITYENLYDLLRNEKFKQELQPLEKNFFEKVVKYLKAKKGSLESQKLKDSVFAPESVKRTKRQVENIQKILKDLYEKREAKISQLALLDSRTDGQPEDPSRFLPEELKLYEEIKTKLGYFRKSVLVRIMNGEKPLFEEEPKDIKIEEKAFQKNLMIRFIEAVPKFVAEDLKEYGPFESEQVANLPYKSAKVLISRKRAEII